MKGYIWAHKNGGDTEGRERHIPEYEFAPNCHLERKNLASIVNSKEAGVFSYRFDSGFSLAIADWQSCTLQSGIYVVYT